MSTITTYGPGGYDPTKPNDNVISIEEVPDEEIEPSPEERLAAVEDAVDLLILDSLGG